MVVMIPIYLVPAIAAGPEVVGLSSNGVNYLVYAFLQAIQFVVGVYVLLAGVRLLLPLLGQFGMENVTFSDSDVIGIGLIYGHILNFFH